MGNVTSSTKPEVHNVLHCPQRRTKPRPQVTCAENFVKYGNVVLRWERTDKHTGIHIHEDRNISHFYTGRKVIMTNIKIGKTLCAFRPDSRI